LFPKYCKVHHAPLDAEMDIHKRFKILRKKLEELGIGHGDCLPGQQPKMICPKVLLFLFWFFNSILTFNTILMLVPEFFQTWYVSRILVKNLILIPITTKLHSLSFCFFHCHFCLWKLAA